MAKTAMKLKSVVSCATDVAEYPFDELKMSIGGGVHEEANLLNRVGKVRPRQGKVL
jgi:hypothetical protein